MTKRIIVVGSGIIGSALACYLAREGARVAVLEAAEHTGGDATPQSWAWINASWGNPKPYFDLRQHSIGEWRACDKSVPGLAVNWCGSMQWDLPPAELEAFVRQHESWGYPISLVSGRKVAEREPHLNQLPEFAAWAPGEGSVEPASAAHAFLAAARAAGAEVLSNTRVKWLREDHGRITGVMTGEGDLDADEVVLAAGIDTNDLLASINTTLDLHAPPGILIHTEPAPELINGLVITPELHVRQTASGILVAGADFRDESFVDDPQAAGAAMLASLNSLIRSDAPLKLGHVTNGKRPMPADGVACVGRVGIEGLYVAVTHSGITLAPAIGKLATHELVQGFDESLLAPFRPDRLLRKT